MVQKCRRMAVYGRCRIQSSGLSGILYYLSCIRSEFYCYIQLSLLCLFQVIVIYVIPSHAQDIEERLKAIEKDIKKYEENLRKEQEREFSILNELDRLNSQLGEVRERIRENRRRLRETEGKIFATQKEIASLELRLKSRMAWLKKKVRTIWIYGYTRELEFLLTSRDGGELLRNWRYLTLLARYDKRIMDRLKNDIEELRKKETALSSLRREIKKTIAEIETEELNLLKLRKEKNIVLASVREKREHYERMLRELSESAKRLTKIIEESRIRGSAAEDRSFLSKRGRLSWPVNGKVKIPFGYHKDPLTGVPVFRSGIYILTEEDSQVHAVYSGRVAYTGELRGYGKVIIISHGGNYHSVYANLSEIFFKPGDIIIERQAIGRVGESQLMDGMVLYFEIRYRGKPLDPLQWLKKR
ncbi:MAG: peptidoglycan DD-metalloendopeptidase family protein [Thermodesulfovibrionales bacterium]|nr:peptidoglycan DD-metalloendopeptidase family protein [Thermodesulfovibrionales bacterium]